jgi:1-acyl-sn-glycerol-3-phosphate acyltransferase
LTEIIIFFILFESYVYRVSKHGHFTVSFYAGFTTVGILMWKNNINCDIKFEKRLFGKSVERADVRMSGVKSGQRGVKRPSRVKYITLGGLVSLYAVVFKKHKLHFALPDALKPPYIIVGNHSSFFDFVYAVRAFYPERVNFVVARKYFYYSGLRWVMKAARAIPKSLFQRDLSTVITMFGVLKQGGVVGIFPEGQISINGISIDNGETIAKFVKRAGVPVVRLLTGGAYFGNPPWAKTARKGLVESRVDLVLTEEQVRELPVDEIMSRIRQSIFMNSYAWQESNGSAYRGKNLAHGLENILYICPSCAEEFTMSTEGNSIRCRNCGTEADFCEDGHLRWTNGSYFKHIGDWHNWQVEKERTEIAGKAAFCVSEPVELAMLKEAGKGVDVVGRGVFTADKEAYVYSGTLHGRDETLIFPTQGIRSLPFDTGRNFQIYKDDIFYEFRPDNPGWCMKIANICEGLHALKC